ncbi:MAG: hypothetical protein AB9866_14475 [Syntrophobacteraceae bacterium]
MKRNKEIRKVEQALIAAHRGRKAPERDDAFIRKVMLQVRRMGSHPLDSSPGRVEFRSVWAFAAATCCLAILFLAYAGGADLSAIQYQAVQSFVEDSSNIVLAEAFALI